MGVIASPVFLTSTMHVGRVYEAACELITESVPANGEDVVIPVVAECNDSWLNDVRRMQVERADVAAAWERATASSVSGTVRFAVGEDSCDAAAGTLVMIPPGAPHTFANPGDEPAVILSTFTPDLYVRYFRDLSDMIASGQRMSEEAVSGAMARYATTPVTASGVVGGPERAR